jgi:hypothetical protein
MEPNMPIVMGLNGARGVGHDAAAALVIDGRVEVAVEEERLARVKRAYELPPIRALRGGPASLFSMEAASRHRAPAISMTPN